MSERDPSLPAGEPAEGDVRQCIEIAGDLDRNTVEALQLEIRLCDCAVLRSRTSESSGLRLTNRTPQRSR